MDKAEQPDISTIKLFVLEQGWMSPDAWNRAVADGTISETASLVLSSLSKYGYISEEQRIEGEEHVYGIAEASGYFFRNADIQVLSAMDPKVARDHHCLILTKKNGVYWVALPRPLNPSLVTFLKDHLGGNIRPLLSDRETIDEHLDSLYKRSKYHEEASSLLGDLRDNIQSNSMMREQGIDNGSSLVGNVLRLVQLMVANAVRDGASDIHIEDTGEETLVRYRIEGKLRRVLSPPRSSFEPLMQRLRIMAALPVRSTHAPQEGRVTLRLHKQIISLNLSIYPSSMGDRAVLSFASQEQLTHPLDSLGLSNEGLENLKRHLRVPYGLILLTSPLQQGKSTTLSACLEQCADESISLLHIGEAPKEHIRQVTLLGSPGETSENWPLLLQTLHKQDPDVASIDPFPREKSGDKIVRLALTGHLVLATMEAQTTTQALYQMMSKLGNADHVLSAVNLILSQRLVKRLCPFCTEPTVPTPEEKAHTSSWPTPPQLIYRAKGCIRCNQSGYFGQTGIYEWLSLSPQFKREALKCNSEAVIRELAIQEGLIPIHEEARRKVSEGLTTIEELSQIGML